MPVNHFSTSHVFHKSLTIFSYGEVSRRNAVWRTAAATYLRRGLRSSSAWRRARVTMAEGDSAPMSPKHRVQWLAARFPWRPGAEAALTMASKETRRGHQRKLALTRAERYIMAAFIISWRY